jgi:hypothetical protein
VGDIAMPAGATYVVKLCLQTHFKAKLAVLGQQSMLQNTKGTGNMLSNNNIVQRVSITLMGCLRY